MTKFGSSLVQGIVLTLERAANLSVKELVLSLYCIMNATDVNVKERLMVISVMI